MRLHWPHTLALTGFLSLSAAAGTSVDYELSPASVDGGGLTGSSEDYQINLTTASGQAGSSPDYRLRTGFSGQLLDAVGLVLDGADPGIFLNERASRQLGASLRYDDESSSSIAPEWVAWSVLSGPLASIDNEGVVTAGSVYQTNSGLIRAVHQTFVETLPVQIANTGDDDFGIYATDGLADLWQVGYFGEANQNGRPAVDPDSDGISNFQEYAFGMNPLQSFGGALSWSGANLLQRGVPLPFASGTNSSFSFRAVFARRKNHAAAGLSYTVEFSGDLATWKASTSTPTVLADDGEIQAVSVPYPFFVNGKKASYFRVKVQSR